MLMETKYSDGKDEFEDYVFDRNEWSAPTMVSPDEIKERIKSFKLEGREIQDMRFVGVFHINFRQYSCTLLCLPPLYMPGVFLIFLLLVLLRYEDIFPLPGLRYTPSST